MSNEYFNHTAPLARHTLGRAESVNSIFNAVAAGFDKLPDPDVLNQSRSNFAVDTGTANTYVVAMPNTWTGYVNGATALIKISTTNTGASSLNVDGLGARSIKLFSGDDPVAGDLVAGSIAFMVYDGSSNHFKMLSFASQDTLNIATVAADIADVNTIAGISADVTAVAAIDTDVTTVAGMSGDVSAFANRYRIASSEPASGNDEGDLYYNTTENQLYVYDGAAWSAAALDADGALLAASNLSDLANAGTARTNLGLGTAATAASGDFATAAQGAKADTAQQPPSEGAFVDGDKTKLDGIEAGADVTDTANVTAAGALMDSEVDADIKTLTLPANTTISTFGASLVDDATAAAARTTLGLGSISTQAANSVTITGGSISGITDLAVADGGTGASSASAARSNLGLAIGTDVQAFSATLASIATRGSAANKGLYTTGENTWAEMNVTAAGRALLDDADAAAQRTTLGLGTAATRTAADAVANDETLPDGAAVTAHVAANALGVSQTWQDVSGSRAASTSYQNTTGKPIMVSIVATVAANRDLQVSTDNATWVTVAVIPADAAQAPASIIVPDDHYYRIDGAVTSLVVWAELR